jgi:hypothetical protein
MFPISDEMYNISENRSREKLTDINIFYLVSIFLIMSIYFRFHKIQFQLY